MVHDNTTFVLDEGGLHKYRTEIPNMIDDMDLTPHAYRLYGRIKRVAGDSGVCWQGIRGLAEACRMGVGTTQRARKELEACGLIAVRKGDASKGEADEIRIIDVWLSNMSTYSSQGQAEERTEEVAGTCSNEEHPPFHTGTPCSHMEHTCSHMEHKKEPLKKNVKERLPNGSPKKSEISSPLLKKQVSKLSPEEAEQRFEEVCESDPNGEALRELSHLLAEENETGKVAITRVWRELGDRYVRMKERYKVSDEAWAYGFDQAIRRSAPDLGYVLKAAKGYRPAKHRSEQRSRQDRPKVDQSKYHQARADESGGGFIDLAEAWK